jgi:release factor glutamine methyltransferase
MLAAVRRAGQRLGSRAEARILAAHVAGVALTRLDLVEALDEPRLEALVDQRLTGVPLQWLTGRAPFRTVEVAVGPGVFIPRPETELLVDYLLCHPEPFVTSTDEGSPPRVVELCAGSGAISLALATERPGLRQWAVENSPAALPYLRRNLKDTAVTVVAEDMATALTCLDGRVDAVVANPPYVPAATWATLPADVRDFDPKEALVAGADGLDAIRVVADVARRLLRPGGLVVCEHDDSQGETAPAVFRAAGFSGVTDHSDWTGRSRFVTGAQASKQ